MDNPENFQVTPGARQELSFWAEWQAIGGQQAHAFTHTHTLGKFSVTSLLLHDLEGKRKPENVQEILMNMERICETLKRETNAEV